MAKKITTTSDKETKKVAEELIKDIKTGTVIALSGELGAGKTTFAQSIGESLGVKRMTSPTYTLIREYLLDPKKVPFGKLYHIDLYRLNSAAEAMDLGLNEIWFDPMNLILIEWPEKIMELLPSPHIQVRIEKKQADNREISIKQ